MFHPTRCGKILRKFLLGRRYWLHLCIKYNCAGRSCSLINRKDICHNFFPSVAIQTSMASIWDLSKRRPNFVRRHTASSAVTANSLAIIQRNSASVRVAPKSWPKSAAVVASPNHLRASVPYARTNHVAHLRYKNAKSPSNSSIKAPTPSTGKSPPGNGTSAVQSSPSFSLANTCCASLR